MTNKLVNARLNAVMPTDPAVALWTWLKSVWGTTTGYTVPASTAIKFDTKFGEQKGFLNFVIVENMPTIVKPMTLGGARYSNEEVKRIQIISTGTSAKNTKWNMERHIDSLINGNPTGMQTTYGMNEIQCGTFSEIGTGETEQKITALQPNRAFQRVRSFAEVTLKYDQVATSA